MVGVMALGEAERLGNLEGASARAQKVALESEIADLKKSVGERADRVRELEEELIATRAEREKSLAQIRRLEGENTDLRNAAKGLEVAAVEGFRASEEYAQELAAKAAEKIQGTFFVAADYLRTNPGGDFDGFIEAYLEAEARKAAAEEVPEAEHVYPLQTQQP